MCFLGPSNDGNAPPCDDEVLDAKLKEELHFAEMRGVRYKASRSLLNDPSRMRTMLFLAIAIEPLRYLSAWWMRRAREGDRRPNRIPLLDMLLKAASPMQVALQYAASLLRTAGGCDRVQLVAV